MPSNYPVLLQSAVIFSMITTAESFAMPSASYYMKEFPQTPTDAQLISRIKEGDEQAFSKLVKRYENTVWGFAYKLCRDKEKAEESFQDTFVNVFRKIDQFDNRSKFSTWLYTIVANNCLMKRRRRKLEDLLESYDEPPDVEDENVQKQLASWDETPAEKLLHGELKEQLDEAIQKLPDDYKVVFVLRDIEQKTAEETSKITGLSVPAVKSRLRRSRMFLRQQLHEFMKQ
jgi:RNA polymerase sigma-70 factor (ECF subfamily)